MVWGLRAEDNMGAAYLLQWLLLQENEECASEKLNLVPPASGWPQMHIKVSTRVSSNLETCQRSNSVDAMLNRQAVKQISDYDQPREWNFNRHKSGDSHKEKTRRGQAAGSLGTVGSLLAIIDGITFVLPLSHLHTNTTKTFSSPP